LEEKRGKYFQAPSGGPLVQHALLAMLEKAKEGKITIERVVEKMAHAPAILFRMVDRGYLREGYKADIVVVDPNKELKVEKSNLLYKCGWAPFEGVAFSHSIEKTFINGFMAYDAGKIIEGQLGERLLFDA
jgi:dihydroorotase